MSAEDTLLVLGYPFNATEVGDHAAQLVRAYPRVFEVETLSGFSTLWMLPGLNRADKDRINDWLWNQGRRRCPQLNIGHLAGSLVARARQQREQAASAGAKTARGEALIATARALELRAIDILSDEVSVGSR